MYAAAAHKGGAGGVPQAVAKEFVAADRPGKLPKTRSNSWIKKGSRSANHKNKGASLNG